MKTKKPKQKTCRICKSKFIPSRQLQPTCNTMDCMIKYSDLHLSKKIKEKKKEAFRELKKFNDSDIPVLKRKAQKIFNEFIRLRDKNLYCISCGHDFKSDKPRQAHAGHFRPMGGQGIHRFNEKNCHKQCSICNNHLSGNLVPYREALIIKIGLKSVESLENNRDTKKWTKEELQNIIKKYAKKVKELKAN